MAKILNQSNILLCGSPRVGKSTLINAIFQQELAKTHASLNSFTKKVTQYSYEYSSEGITHETIIWDTPGIESWNEKEVRHYTDKLIKQTKPLCMIYCASPGSFAGLDQLTWLVSECHRKNIFCALVCTNMWSGRNRRNVLEEFCRLLNDIHPNISSKKEDNITYYDNVALVTMVNSEEYVDNDFGIHKPPSGVDELIFGIAKCLNRDLMFAWFRSVAHNRSFWSTMSSKLSDLFQVPIDTFNSLSKQVTSILHFLYTSFNSPLIHNMSITNNNRLSSIKTAIEDDSFEDAQRIDQIEQTDQKKLIFTLESEGTTRIDELNEVLSNFGATSYITEQSTVTAVFKNSESIDALHKLWQLASDTKIQCTMVNERSKNSLFEMLPK